jgi:HPt (histidine-containing phosphotransfer) domain-containing protein
MVETLSGGDAAFIKRMVQLFIDTMPPSMQELQKETQQQNWEAVSKLAHKMKATIDSMGIARLKDDIRTIEMNGKKKENVETIPGLVNTVVEVINTSINQLKRDFSL